MRLGLLFGVSASNPLYYVLGAAAVLAVTGIATAVPAWRAIKIEPGVALRWDD
jgi:ABC-type lipoprotein release transport system permease subunit